MGRDGCPGASTPTPTASPAPSAPADPRPNVVILLLDDARADGLDQMPVLQAAIAAAGLRFTSAFVPNSVCTPSRASLLTGQYALRHGTRAVNGPLGGAASFRRSGADQRTLAVRLRAAGYATGLFGKYLNDYSGSEASAGPDGRYYVPPGWSRWRGMTSVEHFGGVLGQPYALVDEHGGVTRHAAADDADSAVAVLGSELRAYIDDAATAGQPFFVVWSVPAPHVEVPDFLPVPAVRHLGVFADLPVARPPNWNETDVADKPRWIQTQPDDSGYIALTDLMRQRAYESLLAVDDELGLLLTHLAARGLERNTLLIVTSDNGVAWGEHRLFVQSKQCPYDICLRVPLLVLGAPAGASTVAAPVLNIDIAPTLLELAGLAPPADLDGRSFASRLAGGAPPARDDFLIEHWRSGRDAGGVVRASRSPPDYAGVRDVAGALTYVEHETGEVELYDLTVDPWQLQNVAGHPAYSDTEARLARRLDDLLAGF